MVERPQVKIIKDLIEPWLEEDLKKFLDREPWGALDFNHLTQTFEDQILPVFKNLRDLPIERLDEAALNDFQTQINTLNDTLGVLDNFSVTEPDATEQHPTITNAVNAQANALYNSAKAHLPYLMAQTKPGSKIEKELVDLEKELKASVKQSKKYVSEVEALLAGVRTATAEKGVTGYTEFFDGEASSRDKSSDRWLTLAVIFAMAASFIAWGLFSGYFSPPQVDPELTEESRFLAFFQLFAGRFVLLGILLTAAIWCGRQFNVQQNLRAINKHRSDTLHTFREFIEAAQTMEGRDQVLQEATRAIFRPLPTGHIPPTAQGAEGSTSIVEIIDRTKNAVTPDTE